MCFTSERLLFKDVFGVFDAARAGKAEISKKTAEKLGLVHGHVVKVVCVCVCVCVGGGGRINFLYLKKEEEINAAYLLSPSGEPCWPRYFQSPLSEYETRAVTIHFTQRKKDDFSDQTCRRR